MKTPISNVDSFVPKSILCLRHYSFSKFIADLIAGVTVGLVALPLAMAFAIASGVSPESGLYCAVIAGFVISALGGSATQIGGPTGAFVVVVFGIVGQYGIDGLYMCTVMAGVMMLLLGVTGLGSAVKFIPRSVVIGFTNGIAVLIASTQIKDLFGLRIEKVPGDFLGRMGVVIANWHTYSVTATTLSIAAIVLILVMRRYYKRVPGTIIAMVAGTGVVWVMHLPVATIETQFGGIPSGLPHLVIPAFRPDLILTLLAPAMTIAMLGSIESLMSAVVADRMSGDKHNPNVELFAQGVANILSPLVGGLPATGAIARTATNIRSGAKTPVAGLVHAITLLLVLLLGAPLAKHIPLCVLSAILMVVAYNMGEWSEIPDILKMTKADIAVWMVTFSLTVFADLTVAVEAGMILSALLFIRKVTSTTTVAEVSQDYIREGDAHVLQHKDIPQGVTIFRIHGPFLFGSADKLWVIEDRIDQLPPVVIFRLRNMTAIDASGIHALKHIAKQIHDHGQQVIFCGMREQPLRLMRKSGFKQEVGPENVCDHFDAAMIRARQILNQTKDKDRLPCPVDPGVLSGLG